MNQSRFIELLNLYVDQELSPADAAELELEIARNPARRRTYEQYCRMHRACLVLFEKESAPAPHFAKLAAAVRDADEKVVAFPGATPVSAGSMPRSVGLARGWWAAGLVAAAACVVVVVMRQGPRGGLTTAESGDTEFVAVERPAIAGVREEPVSISQTARPQRSNYHSVWVAPTLLRGQDSTTEAAALSFASDGTSLEWMKRVQLSPLQNVSSADLVFEARPMQTPESRTYRGRNPYAPDAEPVAFQFQR